MSKIAFMFPGQGSYEAGMGRDVAEAVLEAMAVYEAGSAASGLDLKQICFHDPVENLLDTKLQQPALVATWTAEPDPALISVFFVREADLSRGSIDMFIDHDGTSCPVSTQ